MIFTSIKNEKTYMQFLQFKDFTKMPLLVFMSIIMVWISSLFTINYNNLLTRADRTVESCHPLEKGDPLINIINFLQPILNST